MRHAHRLPKEIKNQEYRVGVTPAAAQEAVLHGHEVLIQTGAGAGAGFPDADYVAAGAKILDTAEQVFAEAEMIVKVKEPQAVERKMLSRRAAAVHLPASGARSGANKRSAGVGLHRHRV